MCLIVFAYKSHPQFDLIFAANRDEFYKRPTRAAQFWDDHPNVLAGKDLSGGGTWMGVNTQGHFAALTNYRDPSLERTDPPSRGKIVLDYLKKVQTPRQYMDQLHQQSSAYMGFNILTGTPDTLLHYSNINQEITEVEPGVHGLSNHLLDTPWPKVEQSKKELKKLVDVGPFSEADLFNILKNDTPAADDQLPQTGISTELEKQISPIFIKTDGYGTRSSTILLIDKQGNVTFEERRYNESTQTFDKPNRFEFTIRD